MPLLPLIFDLREKNLHMSLIQQVILSGGSGSRLWPVSRAMLPKQLLSLVSEQTMLQETAMRLREFDRKTANCLVICNEEHRFLAASQLQETVFE